MRLSTNTIYAMGSNAILRQQSHVAEVSSQLASGRRIVTPADDPRGASQALSIAQAKQVNEQFSDARGIARRHLSAEENELDNVTAALQAVKPLLVQAGNGTLTDADRDSVATRLEGVYKQLLGSANAQDGNGRYIFSGFDTDTQPFVGDPGNVTYQGDAGQRELRVDASRKMPTNDSGAAVFASVTESASYVARAGGGNAGSGVFDDIAVRDTSAPDFGHAFEIRFAESGGQTTYSVIDTTTNTTRVADVAYSPGDSVAVGDSLSITIDGEPADGDRFTLGKGRAEDSNIFDTLAGVVAQLRTPADSDTANAALANTLNSGHRQLDNALDNVLSVRSAIGARMNELDNLDSIGDSRAINYETSLSELQDVDPVKAISEYSLAQVALQFSQNTFSDIQQMSLFSLR